MKALLRELHQPEIKTVIIYRLKNRRRNRIMFTFNAGHNRAKLLRYHSLNETVIPRIPDSQGLPVVGGQTETSSIEKLLIKQGHFIRTRLDMRRSRLLAFLQYKIPSPRPHNDNYRIPTCAMNSAFRRSKRRLCSVQKREFHSLSASLASRNSRSVGVSLISRLSLRGNLASQTHTLT